MSLGNLLHLSRAQSKPRVFSRIKLYLVKETKFEDVAWFIVPGVEARSLRLRRCTVVPRLKAANIESREAHENFTLNLSWFVQVFGNIWHTCISPRLYLKILSTMVTLDTHTHTHANCQLQSSVTVRHPISTMHTYVRQTCAVTHSIEVRNRGIRNRRRLCISLSM